jgi:phosphoglycolate phosphatase-like HAD superfamily hydrolase
MPLRHLVLFDIDGTLLSTNGRGVRAMMVAYTAVWGRDPSHVEYRMSGKTELGISHELLSLLGFSRAEVERGLPDFWEHYPRELRNHIDRSTTTVHPGVRELVSTIAARQDMVLGLLTGNCEAAAGVKLEVAGLDGFQLGIYGAHHEQRDALGPLAVETAQRLYGHAFQGKSIVVIGDTPNDILCGRAVGARTIAVGTGRIGLDTLARYEPDYLFADLSNQAAVLDAIQAP